jgi:hypothetical protein
MSDSSSSELAADDRARYRKVNPKTSTAGSWRKIANDKGESTAILSACEMLQIEDSRTVAVNLSQRFPRKADIRWPGGQTRPLNQDEWFPQKVSAAFEFRSYVVSRCSSCSKGCCRWYKMAVVDWHVNFEAEIPMASFRTLCVAQSWNSAPAQHAVSLCEQSGKAAARRSNEGAWRIDGSAAVVDSTEKRWACELLEAELLQRCDDLTCFDGQEGDNPAVDSAAARPRRCECRTDSRTWVDRSGKLVLRGAT